MSLKHDSSKKLRKEKSNGKSLLGKNTTSAKNSSSKTRYGQQPYNRRASAHHCGKARGILLDIPRKTRPLTDRMKTTIFDVLSRDIVNKDILDLYAGTGSFGLESLSRGAKQATYVDAGKGVEKILIKNIKKAGYLAESIIVREKVEDFIDTANRHDEKYDIIFMDPPYKLYNSKDRRKINSVITGAKELLAGMVPQQKKAKFGGALIIKHPRKYDLNQLDLTSLQLVEDYSFGLNTISIFAVKTPNS